MITVVGESEVRDPVFRWIRELAAGDWRRVRSCHAVIAVERKREKMDGERREQLGFSEEATSV